MLNINDENHFINKLIKLTNDNKLKWESYSRFTAQCKYKGIKLFLIFGNKLEITTYNVFDVFDLFHGRCEIVINNYGLLNVLIDCVSSYYERTYPQKKLVGINCDQISLLNKLKKMFEF